MKRCMIVLLILSMLFVSGYAEGVDFSNFDFSQYNDDQLLLAHSRLKSIIDFLEEEMVNRGLILESSDGSPLYSGEYVVGVDIKSGKYVIKSDKNSSAGIAVFADKATYDEYRKESTSENLEELSRFKTYMYSTDSIFITLNDNELLYVDSNGTVTIEEAHNDFAP